VNVGAPTESLPWLDEDVDVDVDVDLDVDVP